MEENALTTYIQKLEQTHNGQVGFYGINLTTGKELRYNEDKSLGTGSIIKVPLLIAYYKKCAEGIFTPNEMIKIRSDYFIDIPNEQGVVKRYPIGSLMPIEAAALLMIGISDNSATNIFLLDYIPKKLFNTMMPELGYPRTTLIVDKLSLQLFENPQEDIGYSTPRELVQILKDTFQNKWMSAEDSEKILDYMSMEYRGRRLTRSLKHAFVVGPETIVKRHGSKGGTYPEVKNIGDLAYIQTKDGQNILMSCLMHGFVNEYGILAETTDFYIEKEFGNIGEMAFNALYSPKV